MRTSPHWDYKRRERQRRMVVVVAAVTLLVIGLVMPLMLRQTARHAAQTKTVASRTPAPAATTQAPASAYTTASGHYLFNGTIFWGRAIERDARKTNNLGLALSNLSSFHRENYDAWIADLECPVANLTVPYQRQVDSLSFNCPPDIAPYYLKYFNIINLANNHTYDQGHEAFLETQQNLTKAGAQVYGSFDIGDDADRCEVISLPIKLQKADKSVSASALPVAFCGFHTLVRMPKPEELAEVTKYSKIMPVIAFSHMGIEYTATATAGQQQVGHELVDAGADFVIMNHPHWVQNTEAYKGKLIVYSTGNFIFDQLGPNELQSASIDVTMQTPYSENLAKWIKLGADCKASELHDDCFAAAQSAGLERPKLSYKFDLVAGDEMTHRWIPQKANATIQQAVETRANWTQTMHALGQ